ncbi:MAG TPA: GNAT family N-acetyltransferase [Gammaproteobacteria bacterium]|nr:GNAT family N-acetyltransferase [Gammaproteobacteria bacterium]
MLAIKIASVQEIADSRDQWNSLVLSMELPSVFLTWDWITTWMTYFGKKYKVFILFIHDGEELVGILPLAQRIMRFDNSFFSLNVITICGGLELYPDHLDIIHSKSSDVKLIVEQILKFLVQKLTVWDLIYFPYLAEEGALCSYLQSHDSEGFRISSARIMAPFIVNEDGFNYFFKKFKRKKRYNLKRERKKLFLMPNVRMKTIDDNSDEVDLDKALDELFRLHELRTQKKGILSTFAGRKIRAFHRDIIHRFYENGWLRLHFIEENHHPFAVAYGFVFAGRYSYYQSGMNPEWERLSPGKVLISEIIKNEFDKEISEFDFLGGENRYKTFWTSQTRQLVSFKLYRKNFGGTAGYIYRRFRDLIKKLLKNGSNK